MLFILYILYILFRFSLSCLLIIEPLPGLKKQRRFFAASHSAPEGTGGM